MNTSERLGFGKQDRLLIVNADDLGLCRAVNDAAAALLEEGAVDSATIMMPCPWSPDAVAAVREIADADIGVHWTLNSEWEPYRWGPVNRIGRSASLTDRNGWFCRTVRETERRADPEEVREELVAQTEAALRAGLRLTHADNHMGSLYGLASGKDLLEIAFDLCARYGLPFRLPRMLLPAGEGAITPEVEARARRRVRQAEERGIALPDYLVGLEYGLAFGETYQSVKAKGIAMIRALRPGVTEWITHPAHGTDELRAFNPTWEKRAMESAFWRDPDVRRALSAEGIVRIGWRELQRLMARQPS
ncbi:polysaccharide deacetylase family protein [Cohnella nanjingensis]|uniref:Polysaccharide deacetylase family protein n=1 Tax=Cohnella nanjingensis TaxID=1387779 RepID=A0A7X0RKP9_9BACL|nr:polysaccharide deacetylase family protein [Cohnella nanjingensis]MBB6669215.1 polysaccharide deacetylase family protein [Cohnella nanjingensis]